MLRKSETIHFLREKQPDSLILSAEYYKIKKKNNDNNLNKFTQQEENSFLKEDN